MPSKHYPRQRIAEAPGTCLERIAGIAAAEVGVVVPGSRRLLLREPSGATRAITEPEPDPYWPAYDRAVREGWE